MIESQIESRNFIGGEWVPADSGETSEILNPSNPSETLGTTPRSGAAETARAVEAAAAAFPDWKATLPSTRGQFLMEAANIIESRTDQLAHLMAREAGKPMKESRAEVDDFAERAETGMVNVNLPTAGVEFQVPFGGIKESGVGPREQGQAAIDFYSTWKTIAIRPV